MSRATSEALYTVKRLARTFTRIAQFALFALTGALTLGALLEGMSVLAFGFVLLVGLFVMATIVVLEFLVVRPLGGDR